MYEIGILTLACMAVVTELVVGGSLEELLHIEKRRLNHQELLSIGMQVCMCMYVCVFACMLAEFIHTYIHACMHT